MGAIGEQIALAKNGQDKSNACPGHAGIVWSSRYTDGRGEDVVLEDRILTETLKHYPHGRVENEEGYSAYAGVLGVGSYHQQGCLPVRSLGRVQDSSRRPNAQASARISTASTELEAARLATGSLLPAGAVLAADAPLLLKRDIDESTYSSFPAQLVARNLETAARTFPDGLAQCWRRHPQAPGAPHTSEMNLSNNRPLLGIADQIPQNYVYFCEHSCLKQAANRQEKAGDLHALKVNGIERPTTNRKNKNTAKAAGNEVSVIQLVLEEEL